MTSKNESKKRVVLITGSTRGIGLSSAQEFLRNGDQVVVFCRHKEHGSEALRKLKKEANAKNILVTFGDVRDFSDVDRIIRETLEKFGAIDVLINNAGQAVWKPVEETNEKEWDAILETNLKGAYLFARRVIPLMREQGGGTIINISSGLGVRGKKNYSAYCASKFGLVGLTEVLADELEDASLRIYVVLPGSVATKLHLDVHPWENPSDMMTPEHIGKKIFEIAKGTGDSGSKIEVYH